MIVNNIAIEIEGVDKAGKDLIGPYITTITNYAYAVNIRGTLTQLVYNDKFNRNLDYNILYKPLVVFLDVENNDHKIRTTIAHEPKINVNKDRAAYYEYIKLLESIGIKVLKYNTTRMTPMMIAEDVKNYLDSVTDPNEFFLDKPITVKPLGFYKKEDLKDEDVFYEFKMEEN